MEGSSGSSHVDADSGGGGDELSVVSIMPVHVPPLKTVEVRISFDIDADKVCEVQATVESWLRISGASASNLSVQFRWDAAANSSVTATNRSAWLCEESPRPSTPSTSSTPTTLSTSTLGGGFDARRPGRTPLPHLMQHGAASTSRVQSPAADHEGSGFDSSGTLFSRFQEWMAGRAGPAQSRRGAARGSPSMSTRAARVSASGRGRGRPRGRPPKHPRYAAQCDTASSEEQVLCDICAEFEPTPDIQLARCLHIFHKDCLVEGVSGDNAECPYCGGALTPFEQRTYLG